MNGLHSLWLVKETKIKIIFRTNGIKKSLLPNFVVQHAQIRSFCSSTKMVLKEWIWFKRVFTLGLELVGVAGLKVDEQL